KISKESKSRTRTRTTTRTKYGNCFFPSVARFAKSAPADEHMNIHHLELFYYVARHGGIMEAVRNIPYGIQQPAVSGQVAQLEEQLGVTLFQRRPFSLTPAGKKLYQ